MPEFDIEAALGWSPPIKEHSIAVTFEIYEVAEDGEGEERERGWLHPPEDPIWVEPDEYDVGEGRTAVDEAVDYLRGEGATQASSSHFHGGVWYIHEGGMNVQGQVENNSYHLKGFTNEEELLVFQRITGRGQLRGRLGQPRPA